MEERVSQRVLAVPEETDLQRFALAVLKELLPLTSQSRAELEVNLALVTEVPAMPELAVVRDHAHRQLAALCARLVVMVSDSPSDEGSVQEAQRLHALVDGLALHLLHSTSSDDEWAIKIVHEELARISVKAHD